MPTFKTDVDMFLATSGPVLLGEHNERRIPSPIYGYLYLRNMVVQVSVSAFHFSEIKTTTKLHSLSLSLVSDVISTSNTPH